MGYLLVQDDADFRPTCVAHPLDWEVYDRAEARFEAAEVTRLLYVAATRARDELVVGRSCETESDSFWMPLYGALNDPELASELRIGPTPPVARDRLETEARQLQQQIGELTAMRARLGEKSYLATSVTRLANGEEVFRATAGNFC